MPGQGVSSLRVSGYWSWGGSCSPSPPVWSHRWGLRTGEVRLHTGEPVWWAAVLQSERYSRPTISPSASLTSPVPWQLQCLSPGVRSKSAGCTWRVENGACHLGTTCSLWELSSSSTHSQGCLKGNGLIHLYSEPLTSQAVAFNLLNYF